MLPSPASSYYPRPVPIDVDALAAGVQRCLPPNNTGGYIALPPGCDPATVDFRTFCPYNPSEHKHRKRTTRPQLKVLEDTFKRETKPNAQLRKTLAAELDMSPRGVQVWFQNRRAKQKALAKKALSSDKNPTSLNTNGDQGDDVDSPPPSSVPNDDNSPSENTPFSRSLENSPEPSPHHSSAQPLPTTSDDLAPKRESGPSPTGLGLSRTSWQALPRPTAETSSPPSSSASTTPQIEDDGLVSLRRPSLPTHIGQAPPPSSYRVRTNGGSIGAVVRPAVPFDPFSRRMSLDRLATHPYAHLAVAANGAVFGPARPTPQSNLYTHARLPIGPKSPSNTPQGHRADLPSPFGASAHAHDTEHGRRPELMHRASMPAHVHGARYVAEQATTPYRMRPPTDGHLYAISSRAYQPPIPGPLPAPDFSFGTSNSTPSSSESDSSGSLAHFSFPCDSDVEAETEDGSVASYDFSSRFGSMASIADSESSVTSAYYSEVGSFEVAAPHPASLDQDDRRLSCTGQFLDLFTNLDVENGSSSSLDVPNAVQANNHNGEQGGGGSSTTPCPSPSSTVSGGSKKNSQTLPISGSSELAFALHHVGEYQDAEAPSADGRVDTLYGHTPTPSSSRSSSSTSLSLRQHHQRRLALDIPEKFEFDSGIEVVSGTGHYSPVGGSVPSAGMFDYPLPVDIQMHTHQQQQHVMTGHQYLHSHDAENGTTQHTMEYSPAATQLHVDMDVSTVNETPATTAQYSYYH